MKYIILAILLFIVPLLTGLFVNAFAKNEKSLGRAYISGWIGMMAIFEIIALPFIYFGTSLSNLCIAVSAVIAAVIVIGVLKERKNLKDYIKGTVDILKGVNVIWLLACAVIIFQMATYLLKMMPNDDDAFYLATATTSQYTDSLFKFNPYTGDPYSKMPARYVLSPFPLLYSVLSKISGVHVATIAHTFIPIAFILAAYIVYMFIAKSIFKNDLNKVGFFLLFIALIFEFSAISGRTTGVVFLVRLWQGKAFLAAVLVPLIFEYAFGQIEKKKPISNIFYMMTLMIAASFVSSMGILFGPLALSMITLVYIFITRKLKSLIPVIISCIPNFILAGIYIYLR